MVTLPSQYELSAIEEIHAWKDSGPGLVNRAFSVLNWPADKASRILSRVPGADWAVERTVGRLAGKLNDLAVWSVRTEAVIADFKKAGHQVQRLEQIFDLDLAHVDRAAAGLGLKYQAIAAGEGLVTGLVGAPGVPADVVALVTICLRAIGEQAAYCGFDVGGDEEKLFAMNILSLASGPTERAKRKALSQLGKLARGVAVQSAAKSAGAMGQAMKQLAQSVGERLARTKTSQFVPLAGLVFGGFSNAVFAKDVCSTASNLYRERFLAAKYGPEWISAVAEKTGRP